MKIIKVIIISCIFSVLLSSIGYCVTEREFADNNGMGIGDAIIYGPFSDGKTIVFIRTGEDSVDPVSGYKGWVLLNDGLYTFVTNETTHRFNNIEASTVVYNQWELWKDNSSGNYYWYFVGPSGKADGSGSTGYTLDSQGLWVDDNGDGVICDSSGNALSDTNITRIDPDDPEDPEDHTGETGERIEPVCLLSSLPQIGGENYQIDLFGIYMSRAITSDSGNKEFLTNKTGPENFEEILRCAKYDSNAYSEFIEKLRKILKISERFFSAKDTMVIDKDAQQARVERNRAKLDLMHNQLVETILRIFGLLLIVYGFLLAIAGAVDESGIVNRSCTAFLTREKISQENPLDITKKAPEDLQFRFSYIISSLLIVTLGVICISPAIHQFIIEKILWVVNGIKGFFIK